MVATIVALILQRRTASGPHPRVTRYLGIWPLRPARRVVGMMVIAFLGTIALAAVTLVFASVVGWAEVDLSGRTAAQLAAEAPAFDQWGTGTVLLIMLVAIVPSALLTAIPAFGEEIGWRGWLLHGLRPLGTWPALLITGAIWGVWHSPLILLGYNFARPNLAGVALMTGGCIALGVLFGWTRLRSGSVWPAVLAQGALNAATPTFLMLVITPGTTPDGAFVAALGFPGWILIAATTAVLIVTGQFRSGWLAEWQRQGRRGRLEPSGAPGRRRGPS